MTTHIVLGKVLQIAQLCQVRVCHCLGDRDAFLGVEYEHPAQEVQRLWTCIRKNGAQIPAPRVGTNGDQAT